jgi:hypothetical protein
MFFPTSTCAFATRIQTFGIVFVLFACTATRADLVESFVIGQGSTSAEIQFDFSNGNTYMYELLWDGGELSGRDVFDAIAKHQPTYFNFGIQQYEWGDFLTDISIGTDADSGDGSTPPYLNYWHYWTSELENPWGVSMIGFSDRVLANGSRDAWVFGTEEMPATIPAPAAGLILSPLVGLVSRRRR